MADETSKRVVVGAVIDRYEGDKAVLLVGEEEKQVVFPTEALPAGLDEGDYIRLEISFDPQATEQAQQEADALLRSIQERNL